MSFVESVYLLFRYQDLVICRDFEAYELTYEQWRSVLRLSTRWGFDSLRKLASKSIKSPTPYDQLLLARTYSVDQWVLPALTALCKRTLPLSLDEAQQMSMEDVILVATVQEEIRGGTLRVNVAEIPRYIEVAQAGKLNTPVGPHVYWDGPENRSTGKESNSMVVSGVGPNTEAALASSSGKKGGDTDESGGEHSVSRSELSLICNAGDGFVKSCSQKNF